MDAVIRRVQGGLDAVAIECSAPRADNTNRGALPARLERVEQLVHVKEKACACCGGDLHVIEEDVAERLEVVPASF